MNIIEAIKSGKRFRRPSVCLNWVSVFNNKICHDPILNGHGQIVGLNAEDITGEDWEIEEQKLELSWEQIRDAVIHSLLLCNSHRDNFDAMKKELGFE